MSSMPVLVAGLVLSSALVATTSQHETPGASALAARIGADASNPPLLVNISKLPHTVEVNLTAAVTRLTLQLLKM